MTPDATTTHTQTGTQSKVRLKFRVSAFEGAAANSEPRWTEKWGVSLFGYEEFHVTDHLLKLPFQETPPKTVCIFSVLEGALRFRLLDTDRLSAVNGVEKREALIAMGDQIKIGETLTIEVLLAPEATVGERSEPKLEPTAPSSANEAEGPTLILSLDALNAEAKTKQTKTSGSPMFKGMAEVPLEIDEPSFKAATANRYGKPAALSVPSDEPVLSTDAPTRETVRPDLAPGGKVSFGIPEHKIELAQSPHSNRDDSLDSRMSAMTGDSLGRAGAVEPHYPAKAKLDSKLTFAERLLAAVSRVLRRDELNPPAEPFPLDGEISGGSQAEPWNPRSDFEKAVRGSVKPSTPAKRPEARPIQATPLEPQPWIPEPENAAARMRGRALVFLVAAIGATMLAVGIFRILNQVEAARQEEKLPTFSDWQMPRGIPIEFIKEKVRKMKKR